MDIHVSEQWPGYWHAVDWDIYDGAPDSSPRARCVGEGKTADEAIADLKTKLAEWDE